MGDANPSRQPNGSQWPNASAWDPTEIQIPAVVFKDANTIDECVQAAARWMREECAKVVDKVGCDCGCDEHYAFCATKLAGEIRLVGTNHE